MYCKPPSGRYTLIIAEKSKAAKVIAHSISDNPTLCRFKGIPYWLAKSDSDFLVIAPVAGHLFSLFTYKKGFPVFEYDWVPRWRAEKRASHTRKFADLIAFLSRTPKMIINACDFDIEGSVIGYLVISKIIGERNYKRMKFSSLTTEELRKAYSSLHPQDVYMVEAGLCRHELDWIYGINLSRMLMYIYRKSTNDRKALSVGRVQTPTLVEAINRYVQVKTYCGPPAFNVYASLEYKEKVVSASYVNNPLGTLIEAKEIRDKVKEASTARVASVSKTEERAPPPPPFNLSDLQDEAYRLYGFSPSYTQKIAEELYLDGLISYPRTNSQRLPKDLKIDRILKSLEGTEYKGIVYKVYEDNPTLTPREGKKTDPAHPAIYPTGLLPRRLPTNHNKVYDLIVRRFLASFLKPSIRVRIRVRWEAGAPLESIYSSIIDKGWTAVFEKARVRGKEPDMTFNVGDEATVRKASITRTYMDKPSLYTKASLLRWMEASNIGTESTRAEIIDTLYKRKYAQERYREFVPTPLGIVVAEIARRFFPELTSVDLTRQFEEKIEKVKAGALKRDIVIDEAKDIVSKLIKRGIESEQEIIRIIRGLLMGRVNKCQVCGSPSLEGLCILHSKALENLATRLGEWQRAFGALDKRETLRIIVKERGVGESVREVAKKALDEEIII